MSNHFDEHGHSRMVDVSAKPITARTATAEAFVHVSELAMRMIVAGDSKKGDVLAVARLAAIMATKQTSNLIPLCHSIPIEGVDVHFVVSERTVRCEVTVRTTGRTGIEMEALTAASVAGLTIYDMCKSVDRAIEIGPLRLTAKSGGASGDFQSIPKGPIPKNQPAL